MRSLAVSLFLYVLPFFLVAQDYLSVVNKSYENIQKGNYDVCMRDMNKIIAEDSSYFPAYYLHGVACFYQGKSWQAKNDFRKVMRKKDDFEHVHYYMAMLYYADLNYDSAIAHMSKEISYYPKESSVYYFRGVMYINADPYSEVYQRKAMSDLKKAITMDSTVAEYYYQMGLVQKYSYHRVDALYSFNKAISLDPYTFDYYNERNTCNELISTPNRIRKADLYEGVNNLKKLPEEVETGIRYYYIGKCFRLMYDFSKNKNELDSALYYFDKSLAIDSTNAMVYFEKGRLYTYCHKNYSKACAAYKQAVTYHPRNAEMWLNYAWTLEKMKSKPEAHKAFQKALELSPRDFRAMEGYERTM